MADTQMTSTISGDAKFSGFSQLADLLTDTLSEFKKIQTSDFAAAIGLFKPFTEYGKRALNFTADYTRRHPVRMAITVAALGFAIAGIVKSRASSSDAAETLH